MSVGIPILGLAGGLSAQEYFLFQRAKIIDPEAFAVVSGSVRPYVDNGPLGESRRQLALAEAAQELSGNA